MMDAKEFVARLRKDQVHALGQDENRPMVRHEMRAQGWKRHQFMWYHTDVFRPGTYGFWRV